MVLKIYVLFKEISLKLFNLDLYLDPLHIEKEKKRFFRIGKT